MQPLDHMFDRLRAIGVDTKSDKVVRFDAIRPAEPGAFPSIGARGCFLSHLGVLEKAFEDRLSSVLILEDDCNFVQDFNAKLVRVCQSMAKVDWGMLHGGVEANGEPTEATMELRPSERIDLAHFLVVRGEALRLMPAYLRQMLERPDGDALGGPMHVDGAYCWFRESHPEIKCFVATPRLAYQRSSKTDIHALTWRDTLPVVRHVVSRVRRVANALKRHS